MKHYLIVVILLITACAPAKVPLGTPQGALNATLTPRPLHTLTLLQPPKIRTSVASPVPWIRPTATLMVIPEAQWLSLATDLRVKVQRAINGKLWEDKTFKKEAYSISEQLIDTSTGKIQEDSEEILKRFRWGIELMDKNQLREVIRIIDQYN